MKALQFRVQAVEADSPSIERYSATRVHAEMNVAARRRWRGSQRQSQCYQQFNFLPPCVAEIPHHLRLRKI